MGTFSVSSYYVPGTARGPQRACRLVEDKGAAHRARSSAVAKQLPWNLTVQGAFRNPRTDRWALCSAA